MCLIVAKTAADGVFTNENFQSAISRNPHGMGMMFVENGRVVVDKIVGTPAVQTKLFERHKKRKIWFLHLRWATHGEKNHENCHPYRVLSKDEGDPVDLYMMHNGVMGDAVTTNKSMSDTWNFIENHLRPILKADHTLIESAGVQKFIQDFIGDHNKLVFLRSDNKWLFFNKSKGEDLTGCWLSNTAGINRGKGHNSHGVTNHWMNQNSGMYNRWKQVEDADLPDTCVMPLDQQFIRGKGWHYKGQFYPTMNAMEDAIEDERKEEMIRRANNLKLINQVTQEAKEAEEAQAKAANDDDTDTGGVADDEEDAEAGSEDAIHDAHVDEVSRYVSERYDPRNHTDDSLYNLIEDVAKNFKEIDIEVLCEYETEATVKMLHGLLAFYLAMNSATSPTGDARKVA